MTHTETINRFLSQYGRRVNAQLSLKNGVCVLMDNQQRELAIIELPLESDCVLLHCKMKSLKDESSAPQLKNLLALNFEMNAMRGCWLALDAEDDLRLCSQQQIEQLDASRFAQYLDGFVNQAWEVREFIGEIGNVA